MGENIGGAAVCAAAGIPISPNDGRISRQAHALAKVSQHYAIAGDKLGLLAPRARRAGKDIGGAAVETVVIVLICANNDPIAPDGHGNAKVITHDPIAGHKFGLLAPHAPRAGENISRIAERCANDGRVIGHGHGRAKPLVGRRVAGG